MRGKILFVKKALTVALLAVFMEKHTPIYGAKDRVPLRRKIRYILWIQCQQNIQEELFQNFAINKQDKKKPQTSKSWGMRGRFELPSKEIAMRCS